MKFVSFKKYLEEEDSYCIKKTGVDSKALSNKTTRDAINASILRATDQDFITPYIGLGAVAAVVAYAGIILPQHIFLDNDEGEVVFDATEIGQVFGVDEFGNKIDAPPVDYFVYFEYRLEENGYYKIFASIVNSEELDDLLVDDDNETEEEQIEEVAGYSQSYANIVNTIVKRNREISSSNNKTDKKESEIVGEDKDLKEETILQKHKNSINNVKKSLNGLAIHKGTDNLPHKDVHDSTTYYKYKPEHKEKINKKLNSLGFSGKGKLLNHKNHGQIEHYKDKDKNEYWLIHHSSTDKKYG